MGDYVYGFTKQEKLIPHMETGEKIRVGLTKYLYKPYSFRSDNTAYMDRMATRYINSNAGRDLPKLICIDKFEDGASVHDISKRGQHAGGIYTDGYLGHGPAVGSVIKVNGRWKFTEVICDGG